MKRCVFAGTFDPPTTGHEKVIGDCLKMFDAVTVAVMVNAQKTPLIPAKARKALLEKLFEGDSRVKVVIFEGAVVDLLKQENTVFYVRGIRNTVDFEYENANFFANKKLMEDIVTIYLPAEQDNLHISSTLVKNSYTFGKDFSACVPQKIYADIKKLLEDNHV